MEDQCQTPAGERTERVTALVTTKDIAQLLGATQTYVTNRLTKRADFPKPVVNLSQRMRKWRACDVLAYIKSAQRSPRGSRDNTAR